jgi:hypothetical protein
MSTTLTLARLMLVRCGRRVEGNPMDEIQEPRRRSRWWLVALVVTLIALVGAVVSLRDSGTTSHQVSVAATPAVTTVFVVAVDIEGQSFFVKSVQGLTLNVKGPGTGLQLTRGLTGDALFTDWLNQARTKGKAAAKKNITLKLLDATLAPVASYNVVGALPVSVSVAPIDNTNPTTETLTLSYDGIAPA